MYAEVEPQVVLTLDVGIREREDTRMILGTWA